MSGEFTDLLVSSADSDAPADAIWTLAADPQQTLAADPQQRQAMGRQGRCSVERYFDRATLARQYCKLLDSFGGWR